MLSKRRIVCASSTPPSMHATNPTSGLSAVLRDVGVILDAVLSLLSAAVNRRKRDIPGLL
jgi:hypothetical protein